jgi:hypothetical protein
VCRLKHVEQLRNIKIINFTTRSHLVGSFYEIQKTDIWDLIPLLKWGFILLQRILFNKLYLLNIYFLFRADTPPPPLVYPHSNKCCCSSGVRLVTSPSVPATYPEYEVLADWQHRRVNPLWQRNQPITFSTTIHTDYPGTEPMHPQWGDQWFSHDIAHPTQIHGYGHTAKHEISILIWKCYQEANNKQCKHSAKMSHVQTVILEMHTSDWKICPLTSYINNLIFLLSVLFTSFRVHCFIHFSSQQVNTEGKYSNVQRYPLNKLWNNINT